MTDKGLKQQEQKENNKENRKQTVKVAITSSICALLFIIILLLLILLGLKNCSNKQNNDGPTSSSTPDSSYVDNYDRDDIDNVFKKIVWEYLDFNGFEVPLTDLTNVIAVTYADNNTSFDLAISVESTTNRVYHYKVVNKEYTNHEDFLGYLLDNETDLFLDAAASVDNYVATNEIITTSKTKNKYLISESPSSIKYFSGFYFENNEYHVYQKKELTSSNPFNEEADQIININNLLYGYYQNLIV